MDKDILIQKWLDNDLSASELEAFKKLQDYDELKKLDNSLIGFKAPNYNASEALSPVLAAIKTHKKSTPWLHIAMRVAAIFVLCFGVYYYSTTVDTSITTLASQKDTLILPDASNVSLNAGSSLAYNKADWSEHRDVKLEGEAFFKVAKGSTFNVITDLGTVSVLGTQFNVKQRENYFEVVCYEGLVSVSFNSEQRKLKAGEHVLFIDGKLIISDPETKNTPSWLQNESYFKSLPYKYVISEFERQFGLSIDTKHIDTELLFTGNFSHNDIDIALKSITLPLQITYSKTNQTITLIRE
ncbi:anti-sigma factor [Flavobacteriales bacterium 34_180_T64]|nr:anti-sigma factor [Flavobacteriales bacterium 34_180_T64]